jgi:hypothetical protein
MDIMWLFGENALDRPSQSEPFEQHPASYSKCGSPLSYIERLVPKRICDILLEWFGKDSFDIPAPLKSPFEGPRLDASHPLPLRDCQPTTVEFKESVVSFVVGLLEDGSPTYIPRRIGAIVVNAVYLILPRWAWANITKERREAGPPLWMHRNSSSSIAWVISSPPVVATLFDIAPSRPLWGVFHGDKYTINFAPIKAV